MNTVRKASGIAMASAAAALFLAGCQTGSPNAGMSSEAKTAQVKCFGINACKGTTQCATATNACKGHNSCKGTGWMMTTQSTCDDKGGTVKG